MTTDAPTGPTTAIAPTDPFTAVPTATTIAPTTGLDLQLHLLDQRVQLRLLTCDEGGCRLDQGLRR